MAEGSQSRTLSMHIFKHTEEAERERLEMGIGRELSKPTPSDLLPPARLHLLNLHQQSHQLGLSIHILGVYGGQSHSNQHRGTDDKGTSLRSCP